MTVGLEERALARRSLSTNLSCDAAAGGPPDRVEALEAALQQSD
jgi:hypothetical protein